MFGSRSLRGRHSTTAKHALAARIHQSFSLCINDYVAKRRAQAHPPWHALATRTTTTRAAGGVCPVVLTAAISVLLLTLSACGGTSSDPAQNVSIPIVGGKPGSLPGNPDVNHNDGQFRILTPSVSIKAALGTIADTVEVVGSVSGFRGNELYVYVDLGDSRLISDADVYLDDGSGILELQPVDPIDLRQVGNYRETYSVRACSDSGCNEHLPGSPATFTVNYQVLDYLDTDNDGIRDIDDTDDDNDSVEDIYDRFPLDASESSDFDYDGIGDNADTDDDNDGVADLSDAFPLNENIAFSETIVEFEVIGDGDITLDDTSINCSTGQCEYTHVNSADDHRIQFEITAAEHFSIDNWREIIGCTDNEYLPCELDSGFTQRLNYQIDFAEDAHAVVTLNTGSNGSILGTAGEVDCAGNCSRKIYTDVATTFSVQAVPAPSFELTQWNGACNGNEECQITVQPADTVSLSADFVQTDNRFDICDSQSVVNGSGEDITGLDFDHFIPVCGAIVLIAERNDNQIVIRNFQSGVNLERYQLTASPTDIVFDRGNALVYAAHEASFFSRVDLSTGKVQQIASDRVSSMAVSNDGFLFADTATGITILDSRVASVLTQQRAVGGNISFNDLHSRLTGSLYRYDFIRDTLTLTELGQSSRGGLGSVCDTVVISPDGKRGGRACGAGNEAGRYSIVDFDAENPDIVYGEWDTDAYPQSIAFSPDSRHAITANRSQFEIFTVATHQSINTIAPSNCTYGYAGIAQFSADGTVAIGLTLCGAQSDSGVLSWAAFVP